MQNTWSDKEESQRQDYIEGCIRAIRYLDSVHDGAVTGAAIETVFWALADELCSTEEDAERFYEMCFHVCDDCAKNFNEGE